MTFRDMTFCATKTCINKECRRHPVHLEHNVNNYPVAMADFEGDCWGYKMEIKVDGSVSLATPNPQKTLIINTNGRCGLGTHPPDEKLEITKKGTP